MFGLFKKAPYPPNLADIKKEHILKIVEIEGSQKAGEIVRKGAQQGSLDCALFMSTLLSQHITPTNGKAVSPNILEEYRYYTELAAEKGDVLSQANMGLYYSRLSMDENKHMNEDGYRNLLKSKYWHERAAQQGLESSVKTLNNMESVYSWAEKTFGQNTDS